VATAKRCGEKRRTSAAKRLTTLCAKTWRLHKWSSWIIPQAACLTTMGSFGLLECLGLADCMVVV